MSNFFDPFDNDGQFKIDLKTGKLFCISNGDKGIVKKDNAPRHDYNVYFHESLETIMLHNLVKKGFSHSCDSKVVFSLPSSIFSLISSSSFERIFILFDEDYEQATINVKNRILVFASFENIKQIYERVI